jgi:hypothetical protein
MKYITVFLMLLFSSVAYCDSLYTGAWSVHFAGQYREEVNGDITTWAEVSNSKHNLIAYETNSYIIGHFKNSFDESTFVVGKRFQIMENEVWNAGIYVGATYGYKGCTNVPAADAKAKVCAAIVPELVYTKYKMQPTVMLLGGALAVGIKWDI